MLIGTSNFIGELGNGSLSPKITTGTKTATTLQLIWKGGTPSTLEQSADGGTTWT